MPEFPEVVRTDRGLPVRNLAEPEQLRALAHPRRLAITDLLMTEGPLTATQCAERLGDSPASCSYHLRQLARFGFVEEAEGGTGRQRPWRWVPLGNRIDRYGSPARRAAVEELLSVLDATHVDRVRRFRAAEASDAWVARGEITDWAVHLTEDELAGVIDQVHAIVEPYQRRTFEGAVPPGAGLVDVIAQIMPRVDRHA